MLLCTIPGISHRAAEIILAEIGLDMTRFLRQTIWHHGRECVLANHESAGKRLSGRSRKGSPWLRKILVEAAHARREYIPLLTVSATRYPLWSQEGHGRSWSHAVSDRLSCSV